MAVTGPFTKSLVTTTERMERVWYRQTKPWRPRLRFTYRTNKLLYSRGLSASQLSTALQFQTSGPAGTDPGRGIAYNDAYAKFKDALGQQAEWAVSLAERRQAYLMILKRVQALTAFTRAVRKLRFGDAWDALDFPRDERRKNAKHSVKKTFASNYLEFHFGWSPLVSDIYSSCEILTRDFPIFPVKGRGRSYNVVKSGGTTYPGDYDERKTLTKCQIIADVNIANPNTLLLAQLGLVNPASVAWELVPFSFVVDWFVNVGDFLASYTDFAGVSLSNIAITYYQTGERHSQQRAFFSNDLDVYYVRVDRQPVASLPGPTLMIRPFRGMSVRRGLAAISLLVNQLRSR